MSDLKYLNRLAKDYPNIMAASAEIINLKAILALPKGTEYFLSDLHGEHEAFIHMLKSASGTIKAKIDEHYGSVLSEKDRDDLAALIYNAEAEIARKKKDEKNFDDWCATAIYRLITICRSVSTKYTRSRVRNRLPKYMDYSMDELLHADDEANRVNYYTQIINSVVECGVAEEYIIQLTEAISRLAVDKLHIIGDVFDRGAHPDEIMDYLMDYHDVDFQWGNHDIVWMGAATGNWACITNLLRMNISYNNFDMLEVGYGINLRPLATFAEKIYGDDPCEYFKPHILDKNKYEFCIVNDFPFFEEDEENGGITFSHNPFSMPQGGMDALLNKNPLDILAYQYDFVCNGYEMASGGVRNHDRDILKKAFELVGYSEDVVKSKFPALYEAFRYGAPPHAGMAPGIDRILMLLKDEENIREVVAFPLGANGADSMMGCPSEVFPKQLKDAHIKISD